ncbi:TPA: hypothetical protein ACPJIH_001975, partial [Haemophilus influenzae]
PLKIAGVRVLADEAAKEDEYYFIIPKVFNEVMDGYPKKMALNVLVNAGIMATPAKPEANYDHQFKVPKKMIGKTFRAYKITPVLVDDDNAETTE